MHLSDVLKNIVVILKHKFECSLRKRGGQAEPLFRKSCWLVEFIQSLDFRTNNFYHDHGENLTVVM